MSTLARRRIHCLRPLPAAPSSPAKGDTRAAITDAIVRLVRTRTGRGPSLAKTEMSSDLALVSLGDCITPAERTLLREGHRKLAIEVRVALYEGMRADAVAVVEAITGRKVAAYLTAHQHDPELAMVAFHFEPRAGLHEV
jgi:uncharacterized protein YbcI